MTIQLNNRLRPMTPSDDFRLIPLLEFWWQASFQYYAWTTTRPAANHLPHREKELQEKKWWHFL
jgi:hypothetical protein